MRHALFLLGPIWIGSLICGIWLSSSPAPLLAQAALSLGNPLESSDIHEFRNDAGEILATGTVQKLSNSRVEIKDPAGKIVYVPLANLSADDQAFVKEALEKKKRRDKAQEVILENVAIIQGNRASEVIKACRKIRNLGKDAESVATTLLGAMNLTSDERSRYELFLTFVEVQTGLDRNITSIFQVLKDQANSDVRERIVRNPDGFLQSYSTLGEPSLEYLKYVAYKGDLFPSANPPVAPPTPTPRDTVDRDFNRLRGHACDAIGNVGGSLALSAIMDILEVAEKPVLDETDPVTIEACIKALGKIGLAEDDVLAALDRHAAAFPEAVEATRKALTK